MAAAPDPSRCADDTLIGEMRRSLRGQEFEGALADIVATWEECPADGAESVAADVIEVKVPSAARMEQVTADEIVIGSPDLDDDSESGSRPQDPRRFGRLLHRAADGHQLRVPDLAGQYRGRRPRHLGPVRPERLARSRPRRLGHPGHLRRRIGRRGGQGRAYPTASRVLRGAGQAAADRDRMGAGGDLRRARGRRRRGP